MDSEETCLPFFPQRLGGGEQGWGEDRWARAALGVCVRWFRVSSTSLLQPLVSPMGCDGIRFSVNK